MATPIDYSAEFTEHDQRGIAWALSAAYFEAEHQTDPETNPSFSTPLVPSVRGFIRWNHVQAKLQLACETGRIVGFKPTWQPTGGNSPTNQVLELRGENCSFTAVHVGNPDEVPRDAAFRRDARGSNQLLMESIELQVAPPTAAPGKMKLLLVHGAHSFEFAAIRCYYDDENGKTTYSTVVANIEKWKDDEGGLSQWTDEEPITPAPIELRPVPVRASDTGR